jgi:hypothetical protein
MAGDFQHALELRDMLKSAQPRILFELKGEAA